MTDELDAEAFAEHMRAKRRIPAARRELEDQGALFYAITPEDKEVTVWPLTLGQGMITRGKIGDDGYEEQWMYATIQVAYLQAMVWESRSFEDEPIQWTRHKPSHRRRPDGDPSQEYVRP